MINQQVHGSSLQNSLYLQGYEKQTKDQHAAKQNTKQQSPKPQSVSP